MVVDTKEDKKLKLYLVLQSFFPLFVLIFIQHVGNGGLVLRFFRDLLKGDISAFCRAFANSAFGDVVITTICITWFILTGFVAKGFQNLQTFGFDSYGEKVEVKQEKKDSGVSFLVSFVLPLLVDDVSTVRGFVFFVALLSMVIFLLMRSDLFYQNPVLVALRYKTCDFQFIDPYTDVDGKKTYIGLTRGDLPPDGLAIKRKYISDNVFLIYAEQERLRKTKEI